MTRFLWFRLHFCSLDLEVFCLHRSSKNWIDFLSILIVGHLTNLPMPYVYTSRTVLISALTLLSIMVTTPILPLAVECFHLASATPRLNSSCCIYVSQFIDNSSHYKFWPTENNNYGDLQGCQRTHTKLFVTVLVNCMFSIPFQGSE